MSLHLVTGYAGVEHITSADQGSYNAATMGEGQFVFERGNKFAASIISNNKVRVLDGDMIMQGRHIRLLEDTYEELNFDNGAQGYKRYDLIVARYTKDATTGIENTSFIVIKGTPSETTPVDPTYTSGDIIHNHALLNDFPLYRVPFDGLNMQELVCLFDTIPTMGTLVTETRGKIDQAIQEMKENVVDNYDDALAVTADNVAVGCKAFQGLNNNLIQNQNAKGKWTLLATSIATGSITVTDLDTFSEIALLLCASSGNGVYVVNRIPVDIFKTITSGNTLLAFQLSTRYAQIHYVDTTHIYADMIVDSKIKFYGIK